MVVANSVIETRAKAFSQGADRYAQVRPGYPDAAVDWLLEGLPPKSRILDLAAGTGKLTKSLVARGFSVIAVDISEPMLAQLSAQLPNVETVIGTAEDIPLPTSSVAAVVCGQAWHWFDQDAAAAEIARVLRPGGILGVIWNIKDNATDWVAQYDAILHKDDPLPVARANPRFGPEFEPVVFHRFYWADDIPISSLRTLAASRSYLLTLPDTQREALLQQVDELAAGHPDLAGNEIVALPYHTDAYRSRRR